MLARIAIGCLAAIGLSTSPALANEPVIGVAASVQSGQTVGAADAEFRELFTAWESLEDGAQISPSGEIIAAPQAAVSVPSRMPLEGAALTSGFGMRTHPVLGGRRRHNGIDLAAPSGTPVYATADGLVGMAQWYSSYGNYVQIEHGGEMQTRYAHLTSYTVSAGDTVRQGDLIGYVGSTGRSTGPHLHYEVRVAGQAVDPRPYMTAQLAVADASAGATAMGGPEE